MDLPTASPREIDTVLAEIYGDYSKAQFALSSSENALSRYRGQETRYATTVASLKKRAEESKQAMAEATERMAPYEAEYKARGGWTRFFMVMNNGGHLHSSMHCSTCRWSTQFGWMPEYSGQNEAGVVDMAGEDACTVCFPSAPVNQQSRLPFRVLEREEKAKLEAEKQAKRDAKNAKAINADGTEWKASLPYGGRENFKTIRSVQLAIHRNLEWGYYYENRRAEYEADCQILAAKLEERTGVPAATTLQEIAAKVQKKVKRERGY